MPQTWSSLVPQIVILKEQNQLSQVILELGSAPKGLIKSEYAPPILIRYYWMAEKCGRHTSKLYYEHTTKIRKVPKW